MASNDSSKEKSKSAGPNLATNFLLLSFPTVQNPFLRPTKRKLVPPNGVLRELHSSITSTAEKCFRFLLFFASENPLLKKITSFSSEFRQHLIRVNCRNHRNVSFLSTHNFAAVLPGDSVAGVVVANGILNFLNIYNTLLVVRLVLTWFPNTPPAIVSPLSTLCDPYLNIFRGVIPPLGGTLDLSPILAFLVLNAFSSTAAALPAELPVTGISLGSRPSQTMFSDLTTCQKKWRRRLCGNKPRSSAVAD